MCGLFGAATRSFLDENDREMVYQLGIVSQLRGVDGAGITTVRRKRNKKFVIKTIKVADNSSNLFELNDTVNLLQEASTCIIMGHTRKATHGAITDKNAQPINVSKITGTHNGIIPELAPTNINDPDNTDSRGFINLINTEGIGKATSKAADGSFALVYTDAEKRTLNFIRNDKRPFFMMYTDNRDVLFWASEKSFLDLLRTREGRASFQEPFPTEPGVLHTTSFGDLSIRKSTIFGSKAVSSESVFRKLQWPDSSSIPPPSGSHTATSRYIGWNRIPQKTDEVNDIIQQHGCITCKRKPLITETMSWVSPLSFVCGTCMKDTMIYSYIRESFAQMFLGHLRTGSYVN